jgi:hypothetical protein
MTIAPDRAAITSTIETAVNETRTIAEMFQVPVDHVAEHAAHIRAGLAAA